MILEQAIDARWAEAVLHIYPGINSGRDFTATQVSKDVFVLYAWNYSQPIPTDDQITAALAEIDAAKPQETP